MRNVCGAKSGFVGGKPLRFIALVVASVHTAPSESMMEPDPGVMSVPDGDDVAAVDVAVDGGVDVAVVVAVDVAAVVDETIISVNVVDVAAGDPAMVTE